MSVERIPTGAAQTPKMIETAQRPHRPFVLRAIITLLLIQAITSAVLTALFVWDHLLLQDVLRSDPELVMDLSFTVGPLAILSPLYLVAAFGLWRLRRWAWVLTMILLAYSMTVDLISLFQREPSYFTMALNVIIVAYLNLREVQVLFGVLTKKDAAWKT